MTTKIILLIIIALSGPRLYSQSNEVLLPKMDVINYPFMEKISTLIKFTDMNSTYPKEVKDRSNTLYSINIRDLNNRQLTGGEFYRNGCYHITVLMDPIWADDIEYKIFEIGDVVYACEEDLSPFFVSCNVKKREVDKRQFGVLMTGGGCGWRFVVLKGEVIVAVYYCIDDCVCEDDVRMYDLLNRRSITVNEYENLYPGLYY